MRICSIECLYELKQSRYSVILLLYHIDFSWQCTILTIIGPELADMVITAIYTDDACARIAGIHIPYSKNTIYDNETIEN